MTTVKGLELGRYADDNSGRRLHVFCCGLSANGRRGEEARASGADFLEGAASARFELGPFVLAFLAASGPDAAGAAPMAKLIATAKQPPQLYTGDNIGT